MPKPPGMASILGMVSVLFVPSTALGGRAGLLEDMVVAVDARARGIGARLLKAAIAQARQEGCLRLTLLTDADNEAAQRFYARAGFQRGAMRALRLRLDRNP